MPSSTFKLHIADPCQQSWDEMNIVDGGRFCQSCIQTVTDFTLMSDEAIQHYFLLNTSGTCGRFRKEQLERITIHIPNYIFQKPIATWKKYLVILLICFGTNIFGGNIVSANPKSIYTDVKKDHHWKNKTKKKRKKHLWIDMSTIDISDLNNTTMGFTASTPEPPTILYPEQLQLNSIKHANDNDPHISLAKNTDQKEPLPEKQLPANKLEFVLPQTALDLQRRISKKK